MTTSQITVKGAREHNLRSVNLSLPRGRLICFTGVSGSGKSSLAFDTLYAEGQRRYVESLSNYARQFMGQMPKPDVDLITGLSPSISISQKSSGNNPRSTVGTITEIYDFLRVLYARVGTGHCPECGSEITAQTRDQIVGRLQTLPSGAAMTIRAPLVRGQKGEFRDLFEDLRRQGYARAHVDGQLYRLSEPPPLDRQRRHDVDVVIDRLPAGHRDRTRLAEAVEAALRMGDGTAIAQLTEEDSTLEDEDDDSLQDGPAHAGSREVLLSSRYACPDCGQSFPPPSPQLFSFNSPRGMCPSCDGLGQLYTFVPELLVPDERLSLKKGAITLIGDWNSWGRYQRRLLKRVAEAVEQSRQLPAKTMLESPWRDLPESLRQLWFWGTGSLPIPMGSGTGRSTQRYVETFGGLIPDLLERYRRSRNPLQQRQYEARMDTQVCPDCHGGRLNAQARAVRLTSADAAFADAPQRSLPQLCELSIRQLSDFFSEVRLSETGQRIAGEALKEIHSRLGFLLGVGLDYLTLGRTAPTLSGGESQRIRLASQIGSGLVGVLYILDEPSIGLHPRDNDRLIETLQRLRDTGNTLIVVEHDEDTMRAADLVVDFGPGPGVRGGRVVASGTVDEVAANTKSVTGRYLSGAESIEVPTQRRPLTDRRLVVRGAAQNNLRGIDVELPLGTLLCVTGVSGSGKSSLVGDILEPALRRALNGAECEPGLHESIEGLEHLDKVIAIDQSPIGRTPRSNPATYVKVFDEIRNLFARMPEAKTRGYTASRFSFNVAVGRCGACDGNGASRLDMDFLADVWVTCPLCGGSRYNRETLAVKFKDHSIADVLDLEIGAALRLFENVPKIAERLETLHEVGLDYLRLGQPSPTLSGGEAQRIKLSRELSRRATGRTLYVLDEPTTGLHFADIRLLLKVLHGLADRGNTVLVVEHNLDVIKTADWVIDLGPEGGGGGGRIVAAGTPQQLAEHPTSHTGRALAKVLGGRPPAGKARSAASHAASGAGARAASSAASDRHNDGTAREIRVEGAAEHNLKTIDVSIPRDAMTVFCGPSGSGKSSLAMDTIYAEGQRRYVESLSSYARQFIGQMQKPKAERIEGLSPAVALEQKNLGHSPRSTVGTVTEVYDYLRILMARLGQMHCPQCHRPVGTQTPDQIVDQVLALPVGTRFLLLAPLSDERHEDPPARWQRLRAEGFARVRIDGTTYSLDKAPTPDPRVEHRLQLVVDRLTLRPEDRSRIADSVELALSVGGGVIQLALATEDRPEPLWDEIPHSQHLACQECGRSFRSLTPHHFSFNTAVGWCPQCEGLGTQTGTNPAALLRDPHMTLADGALRLWPDVSQPLARGMLSALSRHTGVPLDVPVDELSGIHRRMLYHGTGDAWIEVRGSDVGNDPSDAALQFRFQFKGFYPALEEAARLTPSLRSRLEPFVDQIDCSACDGARLRDDAAAVRFQDATLGDLVRMPLGRLMTTVKGWKLDARERKIAGELVREIRHRLQFLIDIGLEYLTLGRPAATLSGGEAQRIRLAAQLGSGLCGVLYVLDEPTIGLHPRDNQRLLGALHRLRDLGNTLLVVEHDREVIAGSDHLCDFGPGAGRFGGRIVAQGLPGALEPSQQSVTGPYLTGEAAIAVPSNRRPVLASQGSPRAPREEAPPGATIVLPADVPALTIRGAREHNLRGVDVSIPLGALVAITGPSGSGKSSLVDDILYATLARRLHRARLHAGRHDAIEGIERIDKVIRVDQSPLGNTPASNPATYTGAFDLIRQLFAKLPAAKTRGFTPRQFSFNVPGGRCEACEGTGRRCIEMHFLPDVWVECEACLGRRYAEETLEVRYRGRSISECLDLSCSEAATLFADQPKIHRILETLCDVGLDYVTLGQAAPTLSGGEAQRVKLAAELARPDTGRTLYLLDEPTTGLHFDDIAKLLSVLQRLVDLGNSVVLIEHNLDVIKCADWVIDLGPEAGAGGGRIVAAGTPEQLVARHHQASQSRGKRRGRGQQPLPLHSYTAEYLAPVLAAGPHQVRPTFDLHAHTDRLRALAQQSLSEADPALTATDALSDAPREPPSAVDAPDPWEVDGRSWHLEQPRDRAGNPVQWNAEMLRLLIEHLEGCEHFAPPDFAHRHRIEIRGASGASGWFLQAFTSESAWLKLKLRVPRGTFTKLQLQRALAAQLHAGGDHRAPESSVRLKQTAAYQEVELRPQHLDELDHPEFWEFLERAIEAFVSGSPRPRPASALPDPVESPASFSPWKLLGPRWHTLSKGFPEGRRPRWPLPMAGAMIEMLTQIAGAHALRYDAVDRVTVRPAGLEAAWAELETKDPESLRLTLAGPARAIDLDSLAQLGVDGPVDLDDPQRCRITLNLTEAGQIDSARLAQFLESHFDHTRSESPIG